MARLNDKTWVNNMKRIGKFIYARWRENGIYHTKKLCADSQTAMTMMATIRKNIALGRVGIPAPIENIDWQIAKEKYVEHKTKVDKIEDVHTLLTALNSFEKKTSLKNLSQFNKATINEFVRQCKLADMRPGGINRYLNVIFDMSSFFKAEGMTEQKASEGVSRCKGEGANRARFLTDAEVKAYFEKAHGNFLKFGLLALYTGFRPGEVLMTDIFNDIDLEQNTIRVTEKPEFDWHPKTYQTRYQSLNPELIPFIQSWRAQANAKHFLIYGNDGKPMSEPSFSASFRKNMASKLGIKGLVPYTFRHTFATRYYRETKDIYELMKVLGHQDLKTTEKNYMHVADNNDKATKRVSFAGLLPQKEAMFKVI